MNLPEINNIIIKSAPNMINEAAWNQGSFVARFIKFLFK